MRSKIEILVYVDMLVNTVRIGWLKVELVIPCSTTQPSLLKSRECGSGRNLWHILRLCNNYLGLFLEIPLFRGCVFLGWRGLVNNGLPCTATCALSNKVVLGLLFIINDDFLFVVL